MADQYLEWSGSITQNNDTTTELSLGTRFGVSQARPCTGIRIRIPSVIPSGPSPAFVSLWNILDEVTPLEVGQFEWSAYSALLNTYQIVPLDSPVDLAVDQTYVAVFQTFERWAGIIAYPFPLTTGIITAGVANGWVKVGYGYPNVQNGAGYSFLVSPVMDVAPAVTSTLDLSAPAATFTASATSTSTAELDLEPLAATFAGAASPSRNIDLTFSRPRGGWATTKPRGRWSTTEPRG